MAGNIKQLPSNFWKSRVIQHRMFVEASVEGSRCGTSDKKHYWFIVPHADTQHGSIVFKNYPDNIENCDPHELQQEFAREVLQGLLHHAHFDGTWMVGWTHPPTSYGVLTDTENAWGRMAMVWLDGDGDPKYTIESDHKFHKQFNNGVNYYINFAHQAQKQYEEMYGEKRLKSDMMLREDQVTKAALSALQ